MWIEKEIYISVEVSWASTGRWIRRRWLRFGRRLGFIKPYDGPLVFSKGLENMMIELYDMSPTEAPFLNAVDESDEWSWVT